MHPTISDGLASVEHTAKRFEEIKSDLEWTFYDLKEEKSYTSVEAYCDQGRIFLPRSYAIDVYPDCMYLSYRGYRLDIPQWPDLRDYQQQPVDDVLASFNNHHDVMLKAYTGSGKTVMGTYIAAKMGRTTLIVVDQNKLARQWEETLTNLFGYKKHEIGKVQGPVSNWDWNGPDFVIAMAQSMYDKTELPDGFVEYFGTTIFDEFDSVGAEQYSNVFCMMGSENRLSLSATERRDDRKKVCRWHLGGDVIELEATHEKSEVYYVEYDDTLPSYYANRSKMDGRYISEIAEDGYRNAFLVDLIERMYRGGRTLLVIGARIGHLEGLHAMCLMNGIPADDMMVYTGKRNVWKYRKDPTPKSRPENWDGESNYTPIAYLPKEQKVKLHELDHLLHERKIIFATYSVFSKGVDVPELDAGIEVTPRSSFVQIHGRILRYAVGKLKPIWVTIRDKLSYRAEYQFAQRLKEFDQSNVEIKQWDVHKGLAPRNLAELRKQAEERSSRMKNVRIITGAGGRNTIQTKSTGSVTKLSNVSATSRAKR